MNEVDDRVNRITPLAKPVFALSCLMLCAACLDEPSDPGPTDRAPAVDLFAAWPGDESLQIAGAPSVVVGLDESLPLDGSIGAVFFGDGIAIANRMSREVLILDAAGGLLSRHGRRGEGPGEYINLSGIARHADGLITWDSNRFRVTLLDASGEYIGETSLRRRGRVRTEIVGAFGNSVLLETWQTGFRGDGFVGPMEIRQPVTYQIARLSDGEVVFEYTLPGEEQWATREARSAGGVTHGGMGVIFGRTAVSAVTDRYALPGHGPTRSHSRAPTKPGPPWKSHSSSRGSTRRQPGCGSSGIPHRRISRV